MAKMYTFDHKLLCDLPEIRIGDKVYPIDNRRSTVKKIMKVFNNQSDDNLDNADEALKLAFGKNYDEIAAMDMPFPAYQELVEIVMSAIAGEEPKKSEHKEQSFPNGKSA